MGDRVWPSCKVHESASAENLEWRCQADPLLYGPLSAIVEVTARRRSIVIRRFFPACRFLAPFVVSVSALRDLAST